MLWVTGSCHLSTAGKAGTGPNLHTGTTKPTCRAQTEAATEITPTTTVDRGRNIIARTAALTPAICEGPAEQTTPCALPTAVTIIADTCSKGTDNCSKGHDNCSKGTDTCSKGTDNGS